MQVDPTVSRGTLRGWTGPIHSECQVCNPMQLFLLWSPCGEVDVDYHITLRGLIQHVEHSGRSSGRCIACHCRDVQHPYYKKIAWMRANRARDPHTPAPLPANYPTPPPIVDGFLSVAEDPEIKNEMQNCGSARPRNFRVHCTVTVLRLPRLMNRSSSPPTLTAVEIRFLSSSNQI